MVREVQSSIVEKSVAVIDLLATTKGRLTQTEIANETGFNKSSTHRILTILMGQGLVQYDEQDRKYSVGPKLVSWARAAWEKTDLSLIEDRDLRALSQQTGMNVALGVRTENTVTFTKTHIPLPYRLAVKTGGQSELHCTAAGKVCLAHMSEDDLSAFFAQAELEKFTEKTMTSEAELRKEAKAVHRQGYAVSRGEEFLQVAGISAPVLDFDKRFLATISIWAPLRHVSFEDILGKVPLLMQTSSEWSSRFGQMARPDYDEKHIGLLAT